MPTNMAEEKFLGVNRDALIAAWVIFGPALITLIVVVVMFSLINSRLIRANEAVQANGEALAAILEQLEANGGALETMRSNLRKRIDELDALNLGTVEINSGAANGENRLSDFEALEQPQ